MNCEYCQRPDSPPRPNPFSGDSQPAMVRLCDPCATELCVECGGTIYTCICDPDVSDV